MSLKASLLFMTQVAELFLSKFYHRVQWAVCQEDKINIWDTILKFKKVRLLTAIHFHIT